MSSHICIHVYVIHLRVYSSSCSRNIYTHFITYTNMLRKVRICTYMCIYERYIYTRFITYTNPRSTISKTCINLSGMPSSALWSESHLRSQVRCSHKNTYSCVRRGNERWCSCFLCDTCCVCRHKKYGPSSRTKTTR